MYLNKITRQVKAMTYLPYMTCENPIGDDLSIESGDWNRPL
jgi:hypothetical protein